VAIDKEREEGVPPCTRWSEENLKEKREGQSRLQSVTREPGRVVKNEGSRGGETTYLGDEKGRKSLGGF